MSEPVPANPLVLVTGASGFIASHIVAALLERGFRVRGTVRSLAGRDSYAHLQALPGADGRLTLVEADLLGKNAFDEAARGVDYVLHTASPFVLDAKDPERDLVIPAVQGTRSVLASCKKAGGVRRVVLTSSMAAITDEPETGHVLTEDDWNTRSSLERNPYYFSKTMAEREAWRFVDEEKPGFNLVAINPYIVLGPSLSPGVNTSNQLVVDLVKGVYPGIMRLTWGFVDVRDVALAHVLAMTTASAHGRYICAGSPISMRTAVEKLAPFAPPGARLPKTSMDCSIGDYAVKLSSYLQPKGVGQYLRSHVGRELGYSTDKIQRELGLHFRPIEQTLRDTVANMLHAGHLDAAPA